MPPRQSQQGWQGAKADFGFHGGPQVNLGPVSLPDSWLMAMDQSSQGLWVSLNGNPWFQLAGGVGALATLQSAYDGLTGSGSGRTINAANGAVAFSCAVATAQNTLEVSRSGGLAGDAAISVTRTGAVAGIGIAISSTQQAAQAVGLSISMAPATANGVTALAISQSSFAQGSAIVVSDSARIADQSSALAITQTPSSNGTNAYDRHAISCVFNPSFATYTGGAVAVGTATSGMVQITNTPTTGAKTANLRRPLIFVVNAPNCDDVASINNDTGVGVNVTHQPVISAGGAYNDSFIGASIFVDPPVGSTVTSTMRGAKVLMGANATAVTAAALDFAVNAANEQTVPAQFMNGTGFFVGTGDPSVVSNNGSFYWKRDGTAGATDRIWHMEGGAWVKVA